MLTGHAMTDTPKFPAAPGETTSPSLTPVPDIADRGGADPALGASADDGLAQSAEAHRRAARHLLGALFIAAGIAHLTHQRFYRSILPLWLLEARREIDVATGTVEIAGGLLLFVPPLRKVARWTNLAVLAPMFPAFIGELRRPMHRRPFGQHRPGLNPIGPRVLAPTHAGVAGVLWWATRQAPPRAGVVSRTPPPSP